MDNPLTNWFFSTGKVVTNSDKQTVTHFLLDGGKLDITGDYDIFQELYAKYINHKNCIVERKTDIFKFFIDFDINSTELINIDIFINCIQDVIENIYGNEQLCIITAADKPKQNKKNGIMYLKQGYHFHWPKISVDKQTAHNIRKNILIRMTSEFGKIDTFYDSWDKIIDHCVYDANGLRLIGSDKCSISDGRKQYENRVYQVKYVYLGKQYDAELTDKYTQDILLSIIHTSIRTHDKDITKVINLQEYEETEDSNNSAPGSGFTRLSKTSVEYIEIIKFFKNFMTYSTADIRIIQKSNEFSVYIITTKSKYCQNKEGFHSHNNIYFKLTPWGFSQKCLSESEGIYCCCRDYESVPIEITSGLESALGWTKPKIKDNIECVRNDSSPPLSDDQKTEQLLSKLQNIITNNQSSRGPNTKPKRCKSNKGIKT